MAAGTGFPYVLYDLLKKESSSIVMWTSTGTAFGIRDMTAFRQEVLTCYFKHNKFSSFQRQLNLYGFRKVVKGRESGCYMHPSFLRDSPERLTEVKRGVVPPCPPHYSRKIYGSGPRFMSQDDGSDSEPELVVQPRGHWDKALTHSDVATHMKLGEMHVTAAALAAARAQMKDSTTGMRSINNSHAAAAAAAAVHLQAAQAELHGIPGHSRPQPPPFPPHQMMHQMGGHLPSPSTSQGMDVGGRLGPQQHEVDMEGMMRGLHSGEVSMSGNGGGPESGGRYTGVVGGPGCGATTGAPGGEGFRSRPGRTSLSKMFGSKRPPMVATSPGGGVCSGSVGGMPPPPSSFMGGGGGSGSSVSGSQPQRMHQHHHGQHQLHPQQQQQQQLLQQQRQHRVVEQHRYNAPSLSDAQGGGSSRGPMGSGHVFSPPFMAAGGQGGRTEGGDIPMGSAPGGGSAIGILNAKAPSPGAAPSRTSHSSTVASLNRLLEGLEHTLDCPPEDEMYTPIDKRNSFCAQMVSIAQVLEDDPMMHGFEEAKNSLSNLQASHLVQKRRSSVSELAAYLQDMLEGGESRRSITIPPGWTPAQRGEGEYSEDGNGNGGAGNRGAFKRTFDGDYGSYDSFGMDCSGGDVSANLAAAADAPIVPPDGCSRSAVAPGSWECAIKREGGEAGGSSDHADSSPRSNPKRARATPPPPTLAPFSGDSVGRHKVWMGGESGQGQRQARDEDAAISRRNSVRMSLEAARAAGKMAASPNLVQALTCLASGLPGLSDSEESRDGGSMEASGTGEGENSAQGDPGALPARKGDTTSVRIKDEEATGKEGDSESERAVDAAAEAVAGELAKHKNSRRGSNAINDVLTNFSIDRALEQLKSDDGKSDDEEAAGGRADGSQSGMRHRASVYVLMHAIARVNTSNDQEAWEQREGQEPLDCSEGGFAAVI